MCQKPAGFADGPGDIARFCLPSDLALDQHGDLIVVDTDNHCVRKVILPSPFHVTTLAGRSFCQGFVNGDGASARLHSPQGIAIDARNNILVSDTGNHCVRRIAMQDGGAVHVTTPAGTSQAGHGDGSNDTVRFDMPRDLAIMHRQGILIVDGYGSRLRVLHIDPGLRRLQERLALGDLDATFARADTDSSSYLSPEEISEMLGPDVPQHLVRQLFLEMDTNKDGKISLLEFKNYLARKDTVG